MKKIYLPIFFFTFSHFVNAQALELQATSNTAQQLSLRSNNGLELFAFRMDDDGVLRIRRNSNDDVLVIDDDTGNVGIGTEFSGSSQLYVVSEDATATSNPKYGSYSYIDVPGTGSRFGVYGLVSDNSEHTGQRYGVFGRSNSTASGHYGMYCNGNFYYTGSFVSLSDGRFKSDVSSIDDGLNLVMKLKPKKFRFRQDIEGFSLARGPQFGFVAQDVEGVLSNLVETSMHDKIMDSGEPSGEKVEIKSINYIGLIPILTKAIQEQQEEIQELKIQLNLMKRSAN